VTQSGAVCGRIEARTHYKRSTQGVVSGHIVAWSRHSFGFVLA